MENTRGIARGISGQLKLGFTWSIAFHLNDFNPRKDAYSITVSIYYHLFAKKKLQDLAQLPLMLFPRDLSPELHDLIFNLAYGGGIQQNLVLRTPQISSSLTMVAARFGFTIVPESLCCIRLPSISFLPVEDPQLVTSISLYPVLVIVLRDRGEGLILNIPNSTYYFSRLAINRNLLNVVMKIAIFINDPIDR